VWQLSWQPVATPPFPFWHPPPPCPMGIDTYNPFECCSPLSLVAIAMDVAGVATVADAVVA